MSNAVISPGDRVSGSNCFGHDMHGGVVSVPAGSGVGLVIDDSVETTAGSVRDALPPIEAHPARTNTPHNTRDAVERGFALIHIVVHKAVRCTQIARTGGGCPAGIPAVRRYLRDAASA